MDIKKILGFILGAGMGWAGTAIRMGITAIATWLLTKGYVDADTATTLTEQAVGFVLAILAALGSKLNSDVQLNKPAP